MAPSRGPSGHKPKMPKATKVVKPRAAKARTESSRHHSYRTFTSHISALKIAPLRSTRAASRADLQPLSSDLSSAASSHFATQLREWQDRNLSADFARFAEPATPLAESLPMVLHNEALLVEMLLDAIVAAQGKEGLEPLFRLMGHLAHDLDFRFERYFLRTWEVVADKVRSEQSIEGIEWGFECLAWLVKYMSRVLLADGDVARQWWSGVGKWLGREKQQPFVVRFMGEVIGFLLRRAARTEETLERVLGLLLEDYFAAKEPLHAEGLKVAISEAVKGINRGIHSDGVAVMQAAFAALRGVEIHGRPALLDIVSGALIGTLHHTDAEGFEPVLRTILETTDTCMAAGADLSVAAELLFTAVTTRKGSRIQDWEAVIERALGLASKSPGTGEEHVPDIMIALVGSILQYAPITVLLKFGKQIDAFSKGQWKTAFLPLCHLTADLDVERFRSFLTPLFQKHVVENWQGMQHDLTVAIFRLNHIEALRPADVATPSAPSVPRTRAAKVSNEDLMTLFGSCRLLQTTRTTDTSSESSMAELIQQVQRDSVSGGGTHDNGLSRVELFAFGDGGLLAARTSELTQSQLTVLLMAQSRFRSLEAYWQTLALYLERASSLGLKLEDSQWEALTTELFIQLRSWKHEMRALALRTLKALLNLRDTAWTDLYEVMQSIEDTPPSVQTSRFLSAQIRRLSLGYASVQHDQISSRAIPNYCFGLLHLQLSQAWDDAIQVLREISNFQQAEDVILEIITSWLEADYEPAEADSLNWQPNQVTIAVTGFQCSNVFQFQAAMKNAKFAAESPSQKLQMMFDAQHQLVPLSHAFDRSQALRVLRAAIPLAEKRSRLFTPVLLRWVDSDWKEAQTTDQASRWHRKDQKAMLDIFAQFQNPKVLFKSTEVYAALLKLLTNGDLEVQKSALKAILAWKEPGVFRYEQHLNNLLDDARFREEVSVFLRPSEEDGVRAEDVEALSPVLLRLLYGLLVNRSGNASGARGKQMKRKAVFGALAQFPESVLKQFIEIALEPVQSQISATDDRSLQARLQTLNLHPRKQIGVVNTIDDLLDTLASDLEPHSLRLADVVLACLLNAQSTEVASADDAEDSHGALSKTIRQTALRCLTRIYTHMPGSALDQHAELVLNDLVRPRLDNFVAEFAQSLSGVLRLLGAWALRPDSARCFVLQPSGLVSAVAACLESSLPPVEVKQFILDQLFSPLVKHSIEDNTATQLDAEPVTKSLRHALQKHSAILLRALTVIIRQNQSRQLTDAALSCVTDLAACVTSREDVCSFLEVAVICLQESTKKINIPTKRELLRTVRGLLPIASLNDEPLEGTSLRANLFGPVCSLFAVFRDRDGRQLLCDVLASLSDGDEALSQVSSLSGDLNAFSPGRLEEPDYARRSVAFGRINEELYGLFTATQWRPLLYNMLFFIRDEDLSIRASASFSLQRFVEAVAAKDQAEDTALGSFVSLVSKTLLPGVKSGIKESSELVRSEFLAVLGLLVKSLPKLSELSDLVPLLAGNDDEASFFSNVLHLQQHRRLRALRRLASEAEKGLLSSTNTATLLFPILEHFVLDAGQDEGAHNVTADAIIALGALALCLDWSQFRAILRRYVGLMKDMEGKEKTVFRLIGVMVDALRTASSPESQPTEGLADGDTTPINFKLKSTLPPADVFQGIVTDAFLPPLLKFLHAKDDSTVSLRVPVGVVVAKLLKCVPEEVLVSKLPGALLDLCYILRSRDQSARDMTRKTLTEITLLLGPNYFLFVIKALRSALQRGYQLHVLSFTIHSILVENLTTLKPGDFDSCLPELMSVIMDDIFGVAGQEKDAEEYISRMKEVKSSKSFDSMELLAKITTLPFLRQLVMPIRALLMEKLDLRTVKKIDELLRRLALGTSQNAAIVDRDILVFCFELIRLEQHSREKASTGKDKNFDDYKTRRYLVQMEAANKSKKRGATSSYLFKLTRFALDLVRSVLHRHSELSTPENLAGFVPVISEALVSGQEEVQLSVIRLLTSIIRVPLTALESNASVYISEAVKLIKAAPAMTAESAQAALKLMSVTLRDRHSSKIREIDLAYILTRLKPDLEEPDRQGVIFNFIKSVIGRKIVITEVYEVMDMVGAIMVTNQTKQARDLARGVFFQFIMDYPQTKERLSKQISFLVKNLEYPYPEGRQSVLELLHLLLQKAGGNMGESIAGSVFVPLVMMLANDDNAECRESAGVLIKQVLKKIDGESAKTYAELLRQWLRQEEQVLLRRVSLQIWKMKLEGEAVQDKDVEFLLQYLDNELGTADKRFEEDEWEVLFYGLQLFAQIVQVSTGKAFATRTKRIWHSVYRLMDFPHGWIKLASSKLVGTLFGEVGRRHKDIGLATVPLQTAGQIQLSEVTLRQLCRQSLRILRYEGSSQQLLAQTCRNLVFLGKCFGANGMTWKSDAMHSNGVSGHDDNDNDDNDSSDEDGNEDEDTIGGVDGDGGGADRQQNRTALQHILYSLCGTLRRNQSATSPSSLPPKLASLQVLATLTNTLDNNPALYNTLLPTLLHPLLLLTDASIPRPVTTNPTFTEQYGQLVQLAAETMAQLQRSAGNAAYIKAIGEAQRALREKREERRVKRRIDAVARPEIVEKRKRRKVEGKARRTKERAAEYQGRRRGW